MTRVSIFSALFLASTSLAAAENTVSVYGGYQSAPHSDVTVTGTNAEKFAAGWEGRSFKAPAYWGVRGTHWLASRPNIGLSIDFTHAKVYADTETFGKTNSWTRFEFSDGINLLTGNVLYRFDKFQKFEPYVGAGIGVSVPHVEVIRPTGTTNGYQLGGAAFQAQAGLNYAINDRFSVFTEYKLNYTINNVDIDSGDKLKTNVITNAFNFGLTYHF